MALFELIAGFGGWSWVVAGLALLALEILVPGGVLIWFGVAAVMIGIASLQIGLSWSFQWLGFLVLSFASIFVWRAYRKARPETTDQPFLNQRAHRYLGQVHALPGAVSAGEGQLILDDIIWRIRADRDVMVAGDTVRIIGVDGSILLVEASE